VAVNIPVLVEKIGQREVKLHPNLEAVYDRVRPDPDDLGMKFPAAIRDLSTNGAFIAGQALPLLSRVAFTFPLAGYGQIEALGWVLWRRSHDCEIPKEGPEAGQKMVGLQGGFGVLFEAISLDARMAIAKLIQQKVGGTGG
jgi:hypothetical protein